MTSRSRPDVSVLRAAAPFAAYDTRLAPLAAHADRLDPRPGTPWPGRASMPARS